MIKFESSSKLNDCRYFEYFLLLKFKFFMLKKFRKKNSLFCENLNSNIVSDKFNFLLRSFMGLVLILVSIVALIFLFSEIQ